MSNPLITHTLALVAADSGFSPSVILAHVLISLFVAGVW